MSRCLLACVCAVGVAALAGCTEVESESPTGYQPSSLQPVDGSDDDLQRVIFTREGAQRTGLRTAKVEEDGRRTVVPYAALLYDFEGKTFVYTSPKPLEYLREEAKVDAIEGNRVFLADGPRAGTDVVTVGVAEVRGTELEINNH